MYSQQWIRHHLSMAVEMLGSLPKHYKDILKMRKEDQEPWMTAMKEEIPVKLKAIQEWSPLVNVKAV